MQGSERPYQANIWKYYLFHAFLNLQFWFPIWIIYLTEERGLTLAQVTLIEVPFWLSAIFLQIPGAAVADRYGRKPILVLSSALFVAGVFFFALADSFPLLLGAYGSGARRSRCCTGRNPHSSTTHSRRTDARRSTPRSTAGPGRSLSGRNSWAR